MYDYSPQLLEELDITLDNLEKYNIPLLTKNREISESTVALLRAGDHTAYSAIFNAYHAPVKQFLIKILHSEQEAQDITQDVFINLWLKREKVNPQMNIKGFLYSTAKFFVMNHLKHLKVITKYEQYRENDLNFAESPHELAVGKELSILIDLVIARMPKQQATVISMKYNECKSNEEIAKLLNISQETVKVHIKRGKREIREIFEMIIFVFFV